MEGCDWGTSGAALLCKVYNGGTSDALLLHLARHMWYPLLVVPLQVLSFCALIHIDRSHRNYVLPKLITKEICYGSFVQLKVSSCRARHVSPLAFLHWLVPSPWGGRSKDKTVELQPPFNPRPISQRVVKKNVCKPATSNFAYEWYHVLGSWQDGVWKLC